MALINADAVAGLDLILDVSGSHDGSVCTGDGWSALCRTRVVRVCDFYGVRNCNEIACRNAYSATRGNEDGVNLRSSRQCARLKMRATAFFALWADHREF